MRNLTILAILVSATSAYGQDSPKGSTVKIVKTAELVFPEGITSLIPPNQVTPVVLWFGDRKTKTQAVTSQGCFWISVKDSKTGKVRIYMAHNSDAIPATFGFSTNNDVTINESEAHTKSYTFEPTDGKIADIKVAPVG